MTWPALRPPYDEALDQAVEYVRERFTPIGVIAAGTVVRGVPDDASDLDIVVIHTAPFRQRLQRRFNTVPAEIFVQPPHEARATMEREYADGRPVLAHMIGTGRVLYRAHEELDALVARARELLSQGPSHDEAHLLRLRYLAATRYEDAEDRAAADPETARLILVQAVADMLRYHVVAAGTFVPRDKDLLAGVDMIDPETAALSRRLLRSASLSEQRELARRLADRTIGVRGFFEWESEPEVRG
jgi:nucleotidyltransferase-like protein